MGVQRAKRRGAAGVRVSNAFARSTPFAAKTRGTNCVSNCAEATAEGAAKVTREKFEGELYELKGLLAQAYRIKIEVVRAERQAIEAEMQGRDAGDAIIPAVARTVVDDEHLYWPYEGEYWRDELGTYQLDFSMCRPFDEAG